MATLRFLQSDGSEITGNGRVGDSAMEVAVNHGVAGIQARSS